VATEAELLTMAQWLEKEGFCLKKHREVTLSYLNLVFGDCTAPQLRATCKTLLALAREHDENQRHKQTWEKIPLKVSWLALRRMAW
jgi:hypothetical protein